MKEESRNTLNGILGTVIFHLLLLFVFLVVKLGEVKKKHMESMKIEFLEVPVNIDELLANKSQEQVEMPSLDPQLAKNIAVNVADKLNDEISTEKYEEELKEELGITELNQQLSRELPEDNSTQFMENTPEKKKEEKKPQQYKGKTNITVSLLNRTVRRQDVPVYLCENGGVVVVDILVDQHGNVVNASYSNNSLTTDECLIEQAINSSYRFVFNSDLSAEPRQKGTITFQFIPQ